MLGRLHAYEKCQNSIFPFRPLVPWKTVTILWQGQLKYPFSNEINMSNIVYQERPLN